MNNDETKLNSGIGLFEQPIVEISRHEQPKSNDSTGDLEAKIVAALNADDVPSCDLEALLTELDTVISAADKAAQAEREKALDAVASPDSAKAEQSAWAAELRRDRLRSSLSHLQQRLHEVTESEKAARRHEDYETVEAKRDAVAKVFAERYPALTAELRDLFCQAEAVDQDCSRINSEAPQGDPRRLRGVELTARNLESFSTCNPSVINLIRLPDWTHSDRMIWPPPKTPLAVVVAESMTPTHDPLFSDDWAAAREQDMTRRKAAAARREAEEKARQVESRRAYEASLRR